MFEGNANITWDLEGSYHPHVSIEKGSDPASGMIISNTCGPVPDVAITVYPKSQTAQIITNKAFLILAFATYIVGVVALANIINQLWKGTF